MLYDTFAGFPGLLLTWAGCMVGRILQINQALSRTMGGADDAHPAMLLRTFAVYITLDE